MTSLSPRICRGPPSSYSVGGRSGMDRVSKRLLPASGGPASAIPGTVRPFGENLLVREPDGALTEVDGTGKRLRTLVPAACKGRVLHVDAGRDLVMAACQPDEPASATLRFFGAGPTVTLAFVRDLPDFELPEQDVWMQGQPRFIHLAEKSVVDLQSRSLLAVPIIGPRQASATTDWRERQRGIYARRGDGMELRGPPASERGHGPPAGPLRWMRPIKK